MVSELSRTRKYVRFLGKHQWNCIRREYSTYASSMQSIYWIVLAQNSIPSLLSGMRKVVTYGGVTAATSPIGPELVELVSDLTTHLST